MPTELEPAPPKDPEALGAPKRKPWTPPRLQRAGSVLGAVHNTIGPVIETGVGQSPASTS